MRLSRLVTGLLLIVLAGFSITFRADAQTVFGSIAGTITDSTGAVIAGAKVLATKTDQACTSSRPCWIAVVTASVLSATSSFSMMLLT